MGVIFSQDDSSLHHDDSGQQQQQVWLWKLTGRGLPGRRRHVAKTTTSAELKYQL
jgi:hypothetical protein